MTPATPAVAVSMSTGRAKTITVAAVGAAGVLSSLEHLANGRRPPLTTYIGVAVSGVVLLVICEVAPSLGGGLALLLLVGAALRNGVGAARTIQDTLNH